MALNDQGIRFLKAGAEIAVGASAVIANVAGVELWSFLGPVITPSIIALVEEFSSRSLGTREGKRAAGVLLFATMRLDELRAEGKTVRDDGFFSGSSATRSSGEEVIEAVMNAARDTHEEKKLKYLGNLLAQIAVSNEINRSLANELINVSSAMSYTQLCILSITLNKRRYNLRKESYQLGAEGRTALIFQASADFDDIHYQVLDLWTKHIISMGKHSSMFPIEYSFIPSEMTCRELGAHLYNDMRLYDLPIKDVQRIADLLGQDTQIRYIQPDEILS
jgi:hypothetical protein